MYLMAILTELRDAVSNDKRTRIAIANEAGIHPATFSAFMHGKRGLSIETVEQLAKALHYDIRLVRSRK
jgi:transcriptional regulator with XRE-family HTH domain